jgi:hypothetical protein
MLQLIDEVLADPGISHMIKSGSIWTSADFMTKVGILENPPAVFPKTAASAGG